MRGQGQRQGYVRNRVRFRAWVGRGVVSGETFSQNLSGKFRSSRPKIFCKKVFLEILQKSHQNTCARVSYLISCGPETLAQVFSCEFCEISQTSFFQRTPLVAGSTNYRKEEIPDFLNPFKPFTILYFAMAERFCHVTCFSKVYLILYFSRTNMIFLSQKVVTWKLQHFYLKEVMMLSFLHH